MGQSVSSNEKQQQQQVISRSSKWHWPEDLTLHLPDECVAIVFTKLGCQDRNASSLVCKRWRLIDSNSRHHLVLLARSHLSPSLYTLLYSRFSSVSILSLKCSRRFASIDDNAFSCIPTFLTCLKKLKLKGCVDISGEGLHAFSLHKPIHLVKLTFVSCSFGPRGLNSILSNCPSLRDLTLKRLRKLDAQTTPLSITNSTLTRLCLKDLHNAHLFASLPCASKALKILIICRSSGNWDRIFSESLKCRLLAEVQLENVQLGDAGLTSISTASPDLEVLYLSRVSDCTDVGFSTAVTCCRKLRKLHIDACSKFGSIIKSISISSLANSCPRLQELVLMGIPITMASLNVLASNCSLKELDDNFHITNTNFIDQLEKKIVLYNTTHITLFLFLNKTH
ncbi:hypothetical protein GIB67_009381 [Kingdonia uniflora]|uniref:F-box domain-containing protein n=1 Tax=Kingdonia uniflora TaxID=39325 RepID=A0A7J7N393_9MAGN|nr:hypothetical protein GIB67_009381 [Kingdonia uniflora]